MKRKVQFAYFVGCSLLVVLACLTYGFVAAGGGQGPALEKKAGDAFRFNINNINMPINSRGVMAAVTIDGSAGGRFEGFTFLFSGGFFMSGKNPNGRVWANAVASASLVEDYLPGRSHSQSTDNPQIYVVDGASDPFSADWQDWKDAVALGASFYDGNRDGAYNPIDLNGNGRWDRNEDRPDLLGDMTAWTVYTDSKPASQRRYTDQTPRGIDIQQSVFGFRSAGLLGNMLFIRYRIVNSGKVEARFDSVYFGVWADSDLGDHLDDLVGCDTLLNAGFTWNDGPDTQYGSNPPCYLIDFFQGPVAYIPGVTFVDANGNGRFDIGETPLDTAYNIKGQVFGVDTIPGAKNLGISSFVNYVQSDPVRGDPSIAAEARGYNTGRLKNGARLDPCTDTYGSVFGMPCANVNPTYWYSGDPTTPPGYGWIYTTPGDVRQMQNVGPFELKAGEPIDIVVAYIVGRGSDARNSVATAKNISTFAQFIYDRNFETAPPPPPVKPIVRTTEKSIELIWDTHEQMSYRSLSSAYDVRFQGFEVTMYNTKDPSPTAGGLENAKIIARYDKADNVDNILIETASGERRLLYQKGIQLDSLTYATQGVGRIRLVITKDPFTGGDLIKGRPYFVSITGYALNQAALVRLRPSSPDYYLTSASFIQNTANVPVVIGGGIVPGIDFNSPFRIDEIAQQSAGITEGKVYVDEVNRSLVTGHEYKISFFRNSLASKYETFWKVQDATLNTVKADSQRVYADSLDYAVKLIDGLRIRPVKVEPSLLTPTYSTATQWYRRIDTTFGLGYAGDDLPSVTPLPAFFGSARSGRTKVENMRRIEIRFGATQKAYRYVNGFAAFGTQPPNQIYTYAAGMALRVADTSGGRPIPPNFKKGYVDVPFQVWIKDPKRGEERQVICAFMENRAARVPDGVWDPTANLDSSEATGSKEWIIVFDTPYSPDTSLVYTGGDFNGVVRYANIRNGWKKPVQWGSIMSSTDSARADDPLLGALYVVALERRIVGADTLKWSNGEVLTIPITYPFASSDVFTYKSSENGGKLSGVARKAAFDRVNVFPNPLFAFNPAGTYYNPDGTGNVRPTDDPYVTFSNLPEVVSVRVYSLSGVLLRTLTTSDKSRGATSPFLEWDLRNEAGLRVASGMYIAIVSSPGIGEKVLKFAIIMPQKQIQNY
jgi:hypothetical protein